MGKDFLLEINTEELPAGYVKEALESLSAGFIASMDLKPGALSANLATKNKLILYAEGIPEKTEDVSLEILGPPKRIAFDAKGNPTKQAIGFAKNQGVKVEDLKIKKTPKGEYIVIEKRQKARHTKDILKEITPGIIKNIKFKKTMRWDDSGLRFARPIESVLVLFGSEKLNIDLDDIPAKDAGNVTASRYLKSLKLVDSDERKKEIRRLISQALKRLKADQAIDENLLEEVTFLVNSPYVFFGEFDKKFLALPDDVLKASMAKHQRVFPVSKSGRLINKFVAIIDGKRKIKLVRRNYEKILEAKLKDSLFFLDEDTKKPLTENISQLKDLIFQKDLGSMFEKIERLKTLCGFICDKSGEGSLKIDCMRAAELSKADLLTHMVGEFPSLQGVMGGEYALRSKEKKEVVQAIKEHYLPQGTDDDLPKTKAGAILAISDKIDNLVGFCGMGVEKISGSYDPFGIRRNTLGFIQIIEKYSFRLGIGDLVQKTIELYGNKLKVTAEFKAKVVDYIKDRVEFLMGDVRPAELKKAILGTVSLDIADIFKRKKALISITNERYFLEAAKVVERTSNILKGAKNEKIGEVDVKLFKEDLEQKVWAAYLNSKDKIHGLIDKEEYREATKEYGQVFYNILHEFFDKVLVNAEDRSLRLNRLAMMKAINVLYTERVANLALLPQIVVK
ncbi:MAG: glycine--tRNA ligase subunit beta [Candidatus Omnitrophica bacterium]|nr:glycine--tRNA ligase subunit beta [Candidatus Omnitrophota bacterium]